VFIKRIKNIDFNLVKHGFIVAFALCIPVYYLIQDVQVISNLLDRGITRFVLLSIIFFVQIVLVQAILELLVRRKNINIKALKVSLAPISFIFVFTSICLELFNILNQHNVIVTNKLFWLFLIYAFVIFSCFIVYFSVKNKKLKLKWESIAYPAVIVGVFMLYVQPTLTTIMNTDLFESANHGLAIYKLFNFGQLPLLESFDAHMLSQIIWGILYGVLNNDVFGAMFVPYINYYLVIVAIVLYHIVAKVLRDKEFAFLFVLFMPFLRNYFALIHVSAFVILVALYALRKKTYK
jgi:hypothetical protein